MVSADIRNNIPTLCNLSCTPVTGRGARGDTSENLGVLQEKFDLQVLSRYKLVI